MLGPCTVSSSSRKPAQDKFKVASRANAPRSGHDKQADPFDERRPKDPRRAREEGALAVELDHPSCEPHPRECGWTQGRRTSSVFRIARHYHDGALLPRPAAAGPCCGEAACEPDLSCDPVLAWQADARKTRILSWLQGRAELSVAHQGYRRCRLLY